MQEDLKHPSRHWIFQTKKPRSHNLQKTHQVCCCKSEGALHLCSRLHFISMSVCSFLSAGLKGRSTQLTGDPMDPQHWLQRQAARSQVFCLVDIFKFLKMRAVRFKDEDFNKPLITVAAIYSNGLPCNGNTRV
jgi:hypothetical protein